MNIVSILKLLPIFVNKKDVIIVPKDCNNQIQVLGYTGAGKSTISKELHSELGIPHIELDRLIYLTEESNTEFVDYRRKWNVELSTALSPRIVVPDFIDTMLDNTVTHVFDGVYTKGIRHTDRKKFISIILGTGISGSWTGVQNRLNSSKTLLTIPGFFLYNMVILFDIIMYLLRVRNCQIILIERSDIVNRIADILDIKDR